MKYLYFIISTIIACLYSTFAFSQTAANGTAKNSDNLTIEDYNKTKLNLDVALEEALIKVKNGSAIIERVKSDLESQISLGYIKTAARKQKKKDILKAELKLQELNQLALRIKKELKEQ